MNNSPAEQATVQELQRRKEHLANYLQTVLRPDDERLQALIVSLRASINQQPNHA